MLNKAETERMEAEMKERMYAGGPAFTAGKRFVDEDDEHCIRANDQEDDTAWWLGRVDADCGVFDGEAAGNARLSVASDNAVIKLAEHLGVNAVLLAERLQGGGLVRLVEALRFYVMEHDSGITADEALDILTQPTTLE